MNADTPQPYALLTLQEDDEVTLKLSQAFALADLLHCVYSNRGEGPEHENMEWVSAMLFDLLGTVDGLLYEGKQRESRARGVKAPESLAEAQA